MPRPSISRTVFHRPALAAALLASAAGCAEPVAPAPAPAPPPDVTAAVERLGNPFPADNAFTRNVWDMQLFGGRIFLGHGNSIENTGPTAIWALDPASGRLSAEFTTSEEQVDVFRVLGGELYVPGHDARDDWTLGNFYRLEDGGWVKHRTIPHGLHVYDLALMGGKLFAAIATERKPDQAPLMVSEDRGLTWKPAVHDEPDEMYALFQAGGGLYAAPRIFGSTTPEPGALLRYGNGGFARTPAAGAALIPTVPPGETGRVVKPVEFRGRLVYVAASAPQAPVFDWVPSALVVGSGVDDVHRAALPDPSALPFDVLARDGVLYVLTASFAPDGGRTIRVYQSGDAERWTELFSFRAATFARSFEEVDGDFYFGLGTTFAAQAPASGDLLRVRRATYQRR